MTDHPTRLVPCSHGPGRFIVRGPMCHPWPTAADFGDGKVLLAVVPCPKCVREGAMY